MQLPYDPAVVLWDIYPRETDASIHTETYMEMFIAALFVVAKNC